MSNHHANHDHHNNGDIFVPLTDNNNNVSLAKAAMFIVLLGLGVFTLVSTIYLCGGNRTNEEQVEWRIKHNSAFKDSNENEFYKSEAEHSENHEEMKGEKAHGTEAKPEESKASEDKMGEEKKAPETKMDEKSGDTHKTDAHK